MAWFWFGFGPIHAIMSVGAITTKNLILVMLMIKVVLSLVPAPWPVTEVPIVWPHLQMEVYYTM